MPRPIEPVLLTDLYQLTMLQAYLERGMTRTATFELFIRRLPSERGFLVAAGLEQALDFLETLSFTEWELDWLRRDGRFGRSFVDAMETLRFGGEVHAVPEGTVVFEAEPLLRVTASLPEAQLVESRLLNLIHYQTLVASKAARMVLAAPGKLLVEFGLRRAHGAEAAVMAARSSYLAGMSGTSNALAGARFGMPVFGTMAHSYVEACDTEAEAFASFARTTPGAVVLLMDTYDTERAAQTVVELAPRMRVDGVHLEGVRLDSGDLVAHARAVRRILDEGGLDDVTILASGNLDERSVRRLIDQGAPIDGFGIGTSLATSADVSHLDCAYKLVEYDGRPRAKASEGKATWPGVKQIVRHIAPDGRMVYDVLGLADESHHNGHALLAPVMRAGRRVAASPSLPELRAHAAEGLAMLPDRLRVLTPSSPYPVHVSRELRELAREGRDERESVPRPGAEAEEHPLH